MNSNLRKLVTAAVIGAVYAALTMVNPFSYGPIQFRVSEVLCILPFFFPISAFGLAIGCVIANLISAYGMIDIVFGSLATLLAGLCTAAIGVQARKTDRAGWGTNTAACLMPVVFNTPIVGCVLAYASLQDPSFQGGFWQTAAIFGGQVGLGELVVMLGLGLPAMRYLQNNAALKEFFVKLK